jgi:hypothetical protein
VIIISGKKGPLQTSLGWRLNRIRRFLIAVMIIGANAQAAHLAPLAGYDND